MRLKSYWLVGIVALAGVRLEAQGIGAWNGTNITGGGRLSVVAPGLASTAYKMSLVANGVAGDTLQVEDLTPADEPRYRGRFYFDTNNFDPGVTASKFRVRMFTAVDTTPSSRRVFMIALRYCPAGASCVPDPSGNAYGVLARVYTGTGTSYSILGHVPIAPGGHYVEWDWRRETAAGAGDGYFEMWIDGVATGTPLTALANSGYGVDAGRFGLVVALQGANGTLFLDEFESRRQTYIGPLP